MLNLYSIDCNNNVIGYCVLMNGDDLLILLIILIFVFYWEFCKQYIVYIIGIISLIFCLKDSSVWIGLWKYKMYNFDINFDICYVIKIY